MKDTKTIEKYIKNNQLDIEKIMLEYTNYIYVIIKNKVKDINNEDLEEIISDVFLTLWKNQEKLDITKNLSPYIGGITKNLIKKKMRNIKKFENIEDYEENMIFSEGIEIYSEELEKNEIIINKLNQMKQEEKDIFMLFYYEDKKISEISKILNISESKIKSKLSRTRKKLKKEIESEEM